MENKKIIKKIEEIRIILHEMTALNLDDDFLKKYVLTLKDSVDLITELMFPERWDVILIENNFVRIFK